MAGEGSVIVEVVTLVAVIFAGLQLWASRRSHTANFEAHYTDRYIGLLSRLPDEMVLRIEEVDSSDHETLAAFYAYFMLCDEQLAARRKGLVGYLTWRSWETGIGANLRHPPFQNAWDELDSKITERELTDLAKWRGQLIDEDQSVDPIQPWLQRLCRNITAERLRSLLKLAKP